jgi:serine protease AprX
VEKLWFSGITVVAAAGNYGSATGPSGVKYAPGNDPFVITVGAADIGNSAKLGDDNIAPFSAYGYTYDGFMKPEIAASGRYMVGPVPLNSTLAADKAANLVDKANGYIQLSGTSFAAPVIAGTAAQILARHPNWTPDQVKGALMATAMPAPKAAKGSTGAGQVNAAKAANISNPPNPNAALDRFVKSASDGGGLTFDAVSWSDLARSNSSWDAVSWSDVSWSDVSWSDVSWSDVSWSDVSWSDVSWSDSAVEDAAEGDALSTSPNGYALDPVALADLATDPDLAAAGIGIVVTPSGGIAPAGTLP